MDEKKIQIIKKLAFDMADKLKKNDLSSFEVAYDDLKISIHRDAPSVVTTAVAQTPTPVALPSNPVEEKEPERSGNIVKSPIVGTFYKASAPGAEPFVKLGKNVKRGDTLCIVEAMKMLNEIESEFDGEVVEILVTDGELVEYGQPLMIIE